MQLMSCCTGLLCEHGTCGSCLDLPWTAVQAPWNYCTLCYRAWGMMHSHVGRQCAGPQELPSACLSQHLRSNRHHRWVCQSYHTSKQAATTTVMPAAVKKEAFSCVRDITAISVILLSACARDPGGACICCLSNKRAVCRAAAAFQPPGNPLPGASP